MWRIGTLLGLATSLALQPARSREQLEQALDRPIQFELPEGTLATACAALGSQAGVELRLSPETLEALPYGGDTKVKATLRNVTLREGLDRLLTPVGLDFEVSDRGIEIVPHPALLRYGRRAGWDELDTLRALRESRWNSPKDAESWQPRIQFRVQNPAPWSELTAAIARAGRGPADEVLTAACDALGWTWFPQRDHLVILTPRELVQRLLRTRVSVRASHKPLIEVLQQLARYAHISIRPEGDALGMLPAQTRENFSLLAERVTVAEALDQIAAATGLTYRVEDSGVVFRHPGAVGPFPDRQSPGTRPASADPFVAKLVLPAEPGELQIEILIRESELSAEANAARKRLIRDADEIFTMELKRRASND